MKKLSVVLILLMTIFISISSINIIVYAEWFSEEELAYEKQQEYFDNRNFILLNDEAVDNPVDCIAVSEEGLIAVGTSRSNKKYVNVYSLSGNYLYGFSFEDPGAFRLVWNNKNLCIYSCRGNLLVSVDERANLLYATKIPDSLYNNEYYRKNLDKVRYDNEKYSVYMRNDIGFLNVVAFSQVVVERHDTGECLIVYDGGMELTIRMIFCVIAAICFIVTIIVVCILSIKKSLNAYDNKEKPDTYIKK